MKKEVNSFSNLKKDDKKLVMLLEGLRTCNQWPYCNMQCDINITYDEQDLNSVKRFMKHHNLSFMDFSSLSCNYACNNFNTEDKGSNLIFELGTLLEQYISFNDEKNNINNKLVINEELYDVIHPCRITDANENVFSFTIRYKLSNTDFLILASAYLNGNIIEASKKSSKLMHDLKKVLLMNNLILEKDNEMIIKEAVKIFIKKFKK